MSDQETAILIIGIAFTVLFMMAMHFRKWSLLVTVLIIAAAYYIIVAFIDAEEPREPNQTILEQLREKWRDREGEPVDGSRD